ncbi:hypothetical protein [Maritimibacter sp. 55A14]|uniref:hypothetical protein n=1 Tax=Maritimibacter sp. 55A14 TaxID=2174844 RepID=UPI001304E3F7|nr:hypothetical protein [Maritimibacter sp. 55A14]
MADANLKSFHDRISRIEHGGHHGARRGLFGRSRARDPERRGLRLPLRGLLIVGMVFVGMKAALMSELGTEAYLEKVEALSAREGYEAWGARLMAPDPVTIYTRDTIGPFLVNLARL